MSDRQTKELLCELREVGYAAQDFFERGGLRGAAARAGDAGRRGPALTVPHSTARVTATVLPQRAAPDTLREARAGARSHTLERAHQLLEHQWVNPTARITTAHRRSAARAGQRISSAAQAHPLLAEGNSTQRSREGLAA